MRQLFAPAVALVTCILFVLTHAGRFSEVAQRRGYTKQLVERAAEPPYHARRSDNTSDYRFYTNATAREFVM